jgi:exodeoxyribonuclease VII large subunit
VDVIILGRGGGSADELGVFNDEALVRAVAGCRVPVVSAVGHEVDVTLVDFAADARAATPSQAAELIVADGRARRAELRQLRARLGRAMGSHLNESRAGLARLERKLGDPRLALLAHQSELDELTGRLAASSRRAHEGRRADLGRLEQRLAHVHPRVVLQRTRSAFAQAEGRIVAAVRVQRERRRAALGGLAGRLEAMSPLKVLSRGYSIATRDDGRAVRSAADVAPGDALHVRIHEGRVHARVTAVEPEPPAEPSVEPSAAGTDRRGEPRP